MVRLQLGTQLIQEMSLTTQASRCSIPQLPQVFPSRPELTQQDRPPRRMRCTGRVAGIRRLPYPQMTTRSLGAFVQIIRRFLVAHSVVHPVRVVYLKTPITTPMILCLSIL